jgi:hypothetical protein
MKDGDEKQNVPENPKFETSENRKSKSQNGLQFIGGLFGGGKTGFGPSR